MRIQLFILYLGGLLLSAPVVADNGDSFSYDLEFVVERSAWDGISLGDDLEEDRLVEEEYEFEFKLEYSLSDDAYLFFTGALIDETETVETDGEEEKVSGLERKEMGLGYFFGDEVQSELNIGRMEFASTSEWFLWWDEELDGIRLESAFGDFETMIAITEELARDSTGVDFIDPELEDVRRSMLSLAWEFSAGHSLTLYYLDQNDDSSRFEIGDTEDEEKVDEEDADLSWLGITYLGEFDLDSAGELHIELHLAGVSGDETVYEFDESSAGREEVVEKAENRVNGDARSYLLSWTPPLLPDWRFIVGNATGSGDDDPDDSRVKSFRQTGLQDDSEAFGEFYLPELSNLAVDVIGVAWQIEEDIQLSLLNFDYRQRKPADEMRDTSLEVDPSGLSRDLGREVDLKLTIETANGLELIMTAAEFYPGKAYGSLSEETSNFIKFELVYEF